MCNLGSVGLPTKNWANLFHSSNLQTIRRPKLLETVRNGKTSTFLKVWFLENVKFVKVFSHHKLIQDSQEYFKHLEFSHILRMRRYRIRWKMLKMQKNRKYFKKIATKVMKFYKGFTLGITWLLMNITSVILKEKLRFIEISARKLYLSAVILGLKVKSFENKSIRFLYSFEYFNDYLPFKCLMVV